MWALDRLREPESPGFAWAKQQASQMFFFALFHRLSLSRRNVGLVHRLQVQGLHHHGRGKLSQTARFERCVARVFVVFCFPLILYLRT